MTKYVCGSCFGDVALSDFASSNAEENECDFCGATSTQPIAAPIAKVGAYINECLKEEYDDAANWLPYESSEGGWQGTWWDGSDLLDEVGLELPNDDGTLSRAIANEIDDCAWCEKNPFGLNDAEEGRFNWDRFCKTVMHERRFFFSDHGGAAGEVLSPGETLEQIFDFAEQVGLFVVLPVGTKMFRARHQPQGKVYKTAEDLGSPPIERATQTNRMSPPGIVMLYTSCDAETALRETARRVGTYAVGRFETKRDAMILDLTRLPSIPSLFEPIPDSVPYRPRRVLTFLHHVAAEISKPIARDEKIHINYVPTQVVTEYVRARQLADNSFVEGIQFDSAVHAGHPSYVLFATAENMIGAIGGPFGPPDDMWIDLLDVQVVEVNEACLTGFRDETAELEGSGRAEG